MTQQTPLERYAFLPLDEDGWHSYAGWFGDAELSRRVSPPTRQWFEYVCGTPGSHAWLVSGDDGAPVGMVQVDKEAENRASIALVVNPSVRNQQHGRLILRALLTQPALAHLRVFEVGIEPDNVASVRCCVAAGFVRASPEPDADGMLTFVYER